MTLSRYALPLLVPLVLCAGQGAAVADPPIHLLTPTSLNGRPLITDPAVTSNTADQRKQLEQSVPGVTDTIVAFYGEKGAGDLVAVQALAAPLADPAGNLAAAFTSAATGDMQPIAGIEDVTPGPAGGVARCGTSSIQERSVTICGWADRGSLATVIWTGRPLSDAAAEFSTIRTQIEQVG